MCFICKFASRKRGKDTSEVVGSKIVRQCVSSLKLAHELLDRFVSNVIEGDEYINVNEGGGTRRMVRKQGEEGE